MISTQNHSNVSHVAGLRKRTLLYFVLMKITIIGPSSGGKSTLARKIGTKFNIPRLEIDKLWFYYGGHKLSLRKNSTIEQKELVRERIMADVKSFLSQYDNWVIDGTYSKIQRLIANEADTVIYINRPLYKRVFSHLKRIFWNDNRHPEITIWEDIKFTKTIIKRWTKVENERLNSLCSEYKDKLVILKNFKEINSYFESLSH